MAGLDHQVSGELDPRTERRTEDAHGPIDLDQCNGCGTLDDLVGWGISAPSAIDSAA